MNVFAIIKNDGAIVNVCQNRRFLEHFLQILGQFLQKPTLFFQKSREIERFLTILKKAGSFSRWPVGWSNSRRIIRTYDKKSVAIRQDFRDRLDNKKSKGVKGCKEKDV